MDRRSFTSPAPIGPADLALPPTQPIDITAVLAADATPAHLDVRSRAFEMTQSLGQVAP